MLTSCNCRKRESGFAPTGLRSGAACKLFPEYNFVSCNQGKTYYRSIFIAEAFNITDRIFIKKKKKTDTRMCPDAEIKIYMKFRNLFNAEMILLTIYLRLHLLVFSNTSPAIH